MAANDSKKGAKEDKGAKEANSKRKGKAKEASKKAKLLKNNPSVQHDEPLSRAVSEATENNGADSTVLTKPVPTG